MVVFPVCNKLYSLKRLPFFWVLVGENLACLRFCLLNLRPRLTQVHD